MMKKLVFGMFLMCLSASTFAQPTWYYGQVKRVALYGEDGSFIVTYKNDILDDCRHKYAYFIGSHIGEGRLKSAYTMAITSLTTGVRMGVVIDKSINGVGGSCNAMGMTADLLAN